MSIVAFGYGKGSEGAIVARGYGKQFVDNVRRFFGDVFIRRILTLRVHR